MSRAPALILLAMLAVAPTGVAAPANRDQPAFAFDPHPGAELPLAATLFDDHGRPVRLADFFGGPPVVLVLEYLRCQSLCGVTLKNLVATLDRLPLAAGRDYRLLAISIDPRDGPTELAAAEAKYRALYHHPGGTERIHFLGGSADAVKDIADAIGFPFRYDRDTDQYIHPAGFILASSDGRISRYIFGIGGDTAILATGLADAALDRVITPLERLFLLCHIEGAPLGRYTAPVMAGLMIGNIAAGIAGIAVFASIRRRREG